MEQKKRLFSGIQPTGRLHLGNYLGAMQNWKDLQDQFDPIFCIVDLHAITVPQDSETLRKSTIRTAKAYLAAGIDPEKATIFVQSQVSEHTELTWVLNTITRMSDLERMTQFKEKGSDSENAGVGLFDYPVLMAADVLLYDTEVVPVGEDQTQHLELARTLARRFNKRFGETFVVPKTYTKPEGARIMGLDDPTKKMSKSAQSEYNYIALDDTPEIAQKKIMKAVTDSGNEIEFSEEKPALKNLLTIYSLLSHKPIPDIVAQYRGKGYAEFKKDLAEVVGRFLGDFQSRYEQISDEHVLEVLRRGKESAQVIATPKMESIKKRVGLIS